MNAAQILHNLRQLAEQLKTADTHAGRLRAVRNTMIAQAIAAGASEREAAEAAGVSPAIAHRAAKSTKPGRLKEY